MKEFIRLLCHVIAPERDWASLARKLVSVILCASLGALAFRMYSDYTKPKQLGERPVLTVIDNSREKKEVVRRLLISIMESDPSIKSVWLYSWPDALSLSPVLYVGDSINPLPSGTLQRGDEYAIGAFLFGDCVEISREFQNFTCPINGFQDSWGVIVVNYGEDQPQNSRSELFVYGVAQRIRNVLYGLPHPQ